MFSKSLYFWVRKKVQSCKLHFLQNSFLLKLYTPPSYCRCVGNNTGRHFVKAFSAPPSHSYVNTITKAPSLQCWFQSKERVKISWSQVRRVWVDASCYHIVLCWAVLHQNRPVCWSIVVKEWPTAGSQFFEVFPSLRLRRMSVCTFLFIVAVPLNYTS